MQHASGSCGATIQLADKFTAIKLAMLLGDRAIPKTPAPRSYVAKAVSEFWPRTAHTELVADLCWKKMTAWDSQAVK